MERWVWVLVVLIIVAGSPKYVMASDSLEVNIDESLQKYVTVEANDVPSIKGLKIKPGIYSNMVGCNPYLEVEFEPNPPQGFYYTLPDEIQLPDGSRYKPKIIKYYPSSQYIAVDFLYPGEWVIYYNSYGGITIRIHVPDLKVNIELDNNEKTLGINVVHPFFPNKSLPYSYDCWIESSLKIILKDPQGKIVVSKSLENLRFNLDKNKLYNKINMPGEWKLIVYGWSYGYESEGWYGYKKKEPPKHAEISVKAYVNPVIKESPSEIESIVKEAKDTFTIHVDNVEDESKGDIFIKAPCDKFEAKLYDPNGVLYDSTKVSSSCTATFKVPDRERSGYWRIVVSSIDNPDFSNHMEFYVAPERQKIVNVQATGICGPGILAILALLPLDVLRRKKR